MITTAEDYRYNYIYQGRIKRNTQIKNRILIALISVIIILLILFAYTSASSAKDNNSILLHKYYRSIEIKPGDTLTSITSRYINNDKYSFDSYMNEIMYINNINEESLLQSGCYIIVPYYDVFHG